MPVNKIDIGPFSAAFVGDLNSNAVLTRLVSVGTDNHSLSDIIPEKYESVDDNSVQSGLRTVTFNIAFYYDPNDEATIKLARRIAYIR